MKIFKQLFNFLSSIYFALILITTAALTVAAGTFLESKTGSHLFAAQWTYGNPLFLFLLCLFFINILFSACRRWPFKKRHIPFLITHFGLLMIISGTILKNCLGLQGQLSVWEGSGNQHVLLPHTYALHIEKKDQFLKKSHSIILDSFQPNIYYPFHIPDLKCKLIGYAPHVKEKLETWIKNSQAYIAGFPLISIQDWEPSQPILHELYRPVSDSRSWSVIALHTKHVQEALQEVYMKDLILHIQAKEKLNARVDISLQKALEKSFRINNGEMDVSLHLSYLLDNQDISFLNLNWKSQNHPYVETLNIPLQGQDSLSIQSDSSNWLESSFIVDISRSDPMLCLIEDDQENVFFFAFDSYGRVHGEHFSPSYLQTLISYDQGFSGYSTQAIIPIPNFPTGREDKEKAEGYELAIQLRQAFAQQSFLIPPLNLFKQACLDAQVDFAETFVQFLIEWNYSPSFLFETIQSLPPSLEQTLEHLDWKDISPNDQQSIQWTSRILDQLNISLKKGEHPLKVLEKYRWPFLTELQQAQNISPINLLSQQISTIITHLPNLDFSPYPSFKEQLLRLSAYFRIYGIDYRSFFPFQGKDKEQFEQLEAYWKAHSDDEKREMKQETLFETLLTHRIVPDSIPLKLENRRPGIVLEVQQGTHKEKIALAYDSTAAGLKWPILNENYLVRFQPALKELPYRIRLRQARQISYPQSPQIYSYESDLSIAENDTPPTSQTLSMNHVYETWDGYRFYLAGVGTSADSNIKHIQLAVNYDPAKYFLTYPGAVLVFIGSILLFWILPYRKQQKY